MIVLYILFIIFVLLISIYIGLHLATPIDDPVLYILFWIIYLVICLSIGNGVALTYFWGILKKKTGPPGPIGPDGDIGDTGVKGKCRESCSSKTCSISINKAIEAELTKLNGGTPVRLLNSMLLVKLGQMCNSKDYEIVTQMKTPQNVVNYMTDNWLNWINIIFDAGGIGFFTNVNADDASYSWINGVNPFDELAKYDLWNWGLTREFEPLEVEVCDDPAKSNELPQAPKVNFKYIMTNSYSKVLDDYNSGADDDMSMWIPNQFVFENETYYPAGMIAVGPNTYKQIGSMPKFAGDVQNVGGTGPDKTTILVAGDVVGPVDYILKWNSRGSGMKWKSSMWSPIPPAGYVCMGDIMYLGFKKPPTGIYAPIRCIPSRFVWALDDSEIVALWSDRGTGADMDASIFGKANNNEWTTKAIGTDKNGYNLFRCIWGWPDTALGTVRNGAYPFFKIWDGKMSTPQAQIKPIDSQYTNIGIGWFGSPKREAKYSIFTFIGLIPEGIITAKPSGRKYYIIHSGDFYHNDDSNTQIPINSYLILYWKDDTEEFKNALTATGTDEILIIDATKADIRQQWEIVFLPNSENEFRFKSRDSNKYLFEQPKGDLRGRNIYKQVGETQLSDPNIEPYTVFNHSSSAFGTNINTLKYPDRPTEEIPDPSPEPDEYAPDRFIKGVYADTPAFPIVNNGQYYGQCSIL